jgi:hypothetical protein
MQGWIAAYGIPGYGPDASDSGYYESETLTGLADDLKRMLEESADSEGDSAVMYAESGDYETAWNTRQRADAMYNLAANLNNDRQHAPLYAGKPELWAETLERIVGENFPYDVNNSTRIYAWAGEISEPSDD